MRKKNFFIPILLLHILVAATQAQQGQDILPTSNDMEIITSDNSAHIEQIPLPDNDIRHVSISPDGKLMAVASQHQDFDFYIWIYDFQTGIEISSMQGRMDFFRDLIWSPDSSRIAVISGRTTGAGVEIRSVKTYTIERGSEPIYVMGFSDVGFHDEIYPLPPDYDNPSPGNSVRVLPGNPVSLAWSPDSRVIAIAFYERLLVYDVIGDEELFSTEVPGIQRVDWSSDGRMIVTESEDRSVQLWAIKRQ